MNFVLSNGEEIRTFDMFDIKKLLLKCRGFYFIKHGEKIYYYIYKIKRFKDGTIVYYSDYYPKDSKVHEGYMADIKVFVDNTTQKGRRTLYEMDDVMKAKVLLLS